VYIAKVQFQPAKMRTVMPYIGSSGEGGFGFDSNGGFRCIGERPAETRFIGEKYDRKNTSL
jgi:hypothetical protein